MSRHRRFRRGGALLIAVCALAIVGAGCGVRSDGPHRIGEDALPPELRLGRGAATSTTIATPTQAVRLYYVNGDSLVGTLQVLPAPIDPREVVDELVGGPDEGLQRSGIHSVIPSRSLIGDITRAGSRLDVALSPRFESIPSGDQIKALGQLVLTLTALPGTDHVQFVGAEGPLEVPRADGTLATGPVARADYVTLLQPTHV